MPFVIAVIIIILISFVSLKFRAYACFSLIMIGFSAFIAGKIGGESLFTIGGLVFLIGGILILFLTSLRVERSKRLTYMVRLFLYGFFMCVRIMLIMMIIGIPFAAFVGAFCKDYHERIVVDSFGTQIGKVYVDENNRAADGTQYEKYNNPF